MIHGGSVGIRVNDFLTNLLLGNTEERSHSLRRRGFRK
jgi:hypothetical protein